MNLKKNLKSLKAQAVIEYILVFSAMVIGVFVIFGALRPDNARLLSAFNESITDTVTYINKSK